MLSILKDKFWITREKNIGMGVKSDTETVIYLWNYGVFRSAPDGRIRSSEQCHPGDVIGCRIYLGRSKSTNQIFHGIFLGIFKGYVLSNLVERNSFNISGSVHR